MLNCQYANLVIGEGSIFVLRMVCIMIYMHFHVDELIDRWTWRGLLNNHHPDQEYMYMVNVVFYVSCSTPLGSEFLVPIDCRGKTWTSINMILSSLSMLMCSIQVCKLALHVRSVISFIFLLGKHWSHRPCMSYFDWQRNVAFCILCLITLGLFDDG